MKKMALNRFLNRDPLEEAGGLNLYGFCHNDGVNLVDPDGMCTDAFGLGALMAANGFNPLDPTHVTMATATELIETEHEQDGLLCPDGSKLTANNADNQIHDGNTNSPSFLGMALDSGKSVSQNLRDYASAALNGATSRLSIKTGVDTAAGPGLSGTATVSRSGSTVEADLIAGQGQSMYGGIQGDIGATDSSYSLNFGGGDGLYLGLSINFNQNLMPDGLSFFLGAGTGESISVKPIPSANLASVTTDYDGNMHRGGLAAGSDD